MGMRRPCPALWAPEMNKGKLVIVGAGGHGKVAAEVAMLDGWQQVVFVDDRFAGGSDRHAHWPIVGSLESASEHGADAFFVAIGDGTVRKRVTEDLGADARFATLVHPSATLSHYVTLQPGTLVCAGAIVGIDTRLGTGVIINTGARVDHDCVVGDFTHICPGVTLAGGVHIGALSWIGIGATVRQGIRIGDEVMVGAGAVVVSDVDGRVTVMGVPARITSWSGS